MQRLEPGDRVRLVSPASCPDQALVDFEVQVLERWGLVVELGAHVFGRWGYMAGTDSDRLADINDALADPGVRGIVTTRGGAGAYRIADGLDFAAARADPKPLIGFSDITYLHLALVCHAGIGSIHGCLVGATAHESARRLMMTNEASVLERQADAVTASVGVDGGATGPLIGGNLDAVATSVGVRLPSLDGAILFLEAKKKVGLGTVDRQLTQLIASGSLDGVVGVALGSFEGFRDYTDQGWSVADVLQDRLGSLGVPVLGGLFAGHDLIGSDGGPDQSNVVLGTSATIDTAAGTLIVASLME